jgi:hypothetical protein
MLYQAGSTQVFFSLAIILCFIANLLWVDHPNYQSYTLYFALSVLVLAPFFLTWKFWISQTASEAALEHDEPTIPRSLSGLDDLETGTPFLDMGTVRLADVDEESRSHPFIPRSSEGILETTST